ncbi:MAG: pitrilysin family protein [Acidobacteriota bacterium]
MIPPELTAHAGQAGAGLAPARTVLSNGVVAIAKETPTLPAVTISLAIRAGTVCDPLDAPGAVFLLSRLLDRGTATRSAADTAEDLDRRGITLTIGVTRHILSLVCTCLTEDFAAVCQLLGDIVMSPALPEAELAIRKAEVITAIRQDEDSPAIRALESLMALLYPEHPYGFRAKGTVDGVEALTRDRLARVHAERFAPSALTAVVVGDVPAGSAVDVVGRVFGGWRVPPPVPIALPAVVPASQRRRLVISMMNKAQADVAYGFTTIARSDPAYYACSLMNNVFGQYSMGGRLGDSIRERQGMAYYAFSSLDANVAAGPLSIRAGVSPANVDRAVSSIDDEVRRLAVDGVTAKELRESQQYLIGSMPRALETNAGIASFLQTAEFFGLGLDHDLRLPALLRAVTLDDVHAAARMLHPDRATVVIAGPYDDR